MNRIDHLIDCWKSYAVEYVAPPTWTVEAWVKSLRRWYSDGKNLEMVLVGAIYDGLAYGNWPWVSFRGEK